MNKYFETVDNFFNYIPFYLYNSEDTEPANMLTVYLNGLMIKVTSNFEKIVTEEYSIDQLKMELKLCQKYFTFFMKCKPFLHKFVTRHHLAQLT